MNHEPKHPSEILSERERCFVEHILYYHDIAALLAMQPAPKSVFRPWKRKECEVLLASPKIQNELRQRRELQERMNAKVAAMAAEKRR